LIFLIWLLKKRAKQTDDRKKLSSRSSLGYEMNQVQHDALKLRSHSNVEDEYQAEKTLLNTQILVSSPGFLLMNTATQLRKEAQIGSGGCAVIYQGVILDQALINKFDATQVAIKEIFENPKCNEEENFVQFQQEVSILWRCANIANVIKLIGYSNEPRCLVTKLYETDLYKMIHTKGLEITPNMVLSIAFDVANGMKALHGLNIVHRDLKSPNIFLENLKANGRSCLRAVIGDFGLARISSELVIDMQKTVNVQGLSPRYTAPEVFTRLKTGTQGSIPDEMRSDVYSYAIIIWEMIVRHKPWEELKDVSEIELKVCSGERESIPVSIYQGVPTLEFLNELLTCCWVQNSYKRPTFLNIAVERSKTSVFFSR